MATKRYLVGGPSNSGKSTYVLSLAKRLQSGHGIRARAIELDVWSGSYPAFRGEVSFKERPKKFGLDWDWKTPLDERLTAFRSCPAGLVFADLPGQIDEATAYICRNAGADYALVVSRSIRGLDEWSAFFERFGVPVAETFLTFKHRRPGIVSGLNRQIDPGHPDIARYAAALRRNARREPSAFQDRVIEQGWLAVSDGVIAEFGEGHPPERGKDLQGDLLMPGLVELHTDHLEAHYAPRPKVHWDPVAAVVSFDGQLATSGITTSARYPCFCIDRLSIVAWAGSASTEETTIGSRRRSRSHVHG